MDYIGTLEYEGEPLHTYVAFVTDPDTGSVTSVSIALREHSPDTAQLLLDKACMEDNTHELSCSLTRH